MTNQCLDHGRHNLIIIYFNLDLWWSDNNYVSQGCVVADNVHHSQGLLDPVYVAGSRVIWYETSWFLETIHGTCRVPLINSTSCYGYANCNRIVRKVCR